MSRKFYVGGDLGEDLFKAFERARAIESTIQNVSFGKVAFLRKLLRERISQGYTGNGKQKKGGV